ncbi:hypothetical protein N5923_23455 [Erwiniaceae bacterium BAC15a-03b]|uniref:Uncharacterized protein n=1 Tax=Winslowiella arboricola TaxID=2978220 RepID=A0A9J6PXI6_9GAMM|nr:hypothetical protein [Winslowiella arboricola]MCU5775093.1 hypothetical protein [Winslowiella arboricola]MCU5780453.1 hypothetical protein [Winslowiella arboricola]
MTEPEPEEAPVKNDAGSVLLSEELPQVIENDEAPEKHSSNTVQESGENNLNPADSLNLIPDSLNLIPFNTQAAEATCEEVISEEQSQATVHQMAGRYAFEGNIVRLNHKDYESWKNLYPNIDLNYELQKLDIEFTHDKPKNWFITASQKLSYQNKQSANRQPAQRFAGQNRAVSEGFQAKDYGITENPAWAEG